MTAAVILPSHFYGSARVYDATPQGLTALMRSLSENIAQIAAGHVTPLTDNSGAVAGATAAALIPVPPAVSVSGNNCVTEAALDAAMTTAVQALSDVVGQVNTILARVPAFSPLTGPVGFAPVTTVAAITQTFAGASAALAPQAALATFLGTFTQAYEQTRYWVNKIALACGVAQVGGSALGTVNVAQYPQAPVITGAPNSNANYNGTIAVPALPISATNATGTNDSVAATAADTMMVVIAQNIDLLVKALNAAVGASANLVANTVAG
jgi:hypothetical protein